MATEKTIDRKNGTISFLADAPDGSVFPAGTQYEWISPQDEPTGLSRVKGLDHKWGLVDRCGNTVLKAEYDYIWKFEGKQRSTTIVIHKGEVMTFDLIGLRFVQSQEQNQ